MLLNIVNLRKFNFNQPSEAMDNLEEASGLNDSVLAGAGKHFRTAPSTDCKLHQREFFRNHTIPQFFGFLDFMRKALHPTAG